MPGYAFPRLQFAVTARTFRSSSETGAIVPRYGAGIVLVTAIAVLTACGGRGPVPALHEGLHTVSAEITVADGVAAEHGYGSGAVEVMVSRSQLRILINDARLAEADSDARATAATAVVATAEKLLASDPEFPAIQAISVAIVHPARLRAGALSSHTEEIFEFHRGADSHFSPAGG